MRGQIPLLLALHEHKEIASPASVYAGLVGRSTVNTRIPEDVTGEITSVSLRPPRRLKQPVIRLKGDGNKRVYLCLCLYVTVFYITVFLSSLTRSQTWMTCSLPAGSLLL